MLYVKVVKYLRAPRSLRPIWDGVNSAQRHRRYFLLNNKAVNSPAWRHGSSIIIERSVPRLSGCHPSARVGDGRPAHAEIC